MLDIELIKSRKLSKEDYIFTSEPEEDIKLLDKVVTYFDGNTYKIISLDIFLAFPFFYDMYLKDNITIIVCPITLISVMFKGIFDIVSYNNMIMMIKEQNNTESVIAINAGYKIDKKYVIETVRRAEVRIMTFRDALLNSPDCLYLNYNKKLDYIIKNDYYTNTKDYNNIDLSLYNLIHPKTLVYLIQYKSKKASSGEKYSIILGNNVQKDIVTGYNLKKSGLIKYLQKQQDQIIKKNGFTLPMLWYAKNYI